MCHLSTSHRPAEIFWAVGDGPGPGPGSERRGRVAERWGLTQRQTDDLVAEAGDVLIGRYLMVDRHVYTARMVVALEHVTETGIAQGQLGASVQAMALLAKLCAIGAEHDPNPRRL